MIAVWHADADAPTRWKVLVVRPGHYIVKRKRVDFAAEIERAEREAAKQKRRRQR